MVKGLAVVVKQVTTYHRTFIYKFHHNTTTTTLTPWSGLEILLCPFANFSHCKKSLPVCMCKELHKDPAHLHILITTKATIILNGNSSTWSILGPTRGLTPEGFWWWSFCSHYVQTCWKTLYRFTIFDPNINTGPYMSMEMRASCCSWDFILFHVNQLWPIEVVPNKFNALQLVVGRCSHIS